MPTKAGRKRIAASYYGQLLTTATRINGPMPGNNTPCGWSAIRLLIPRDLIPKSLNIQFKKTIRKSRTLDYRQVVLQSR